VPEAHAGVAASLLNVGRQVGGAAGLAVLGTVAWTVAADNARAKAPYRQALAAGFDRAACRLTCRRQRGPGVGTVSTGS